MFIFSYNYIKPCTFQWLWQKNHLKIYWHFSFLSDHILSNFCLFLKVMVNYNELFFSKVKTLGESDNEDDASSWVKKSRKIQKDKELAEKRVWYVHFIVFISYFHVYIVLVKKNMGITKLVWKSYIYTL